MFSPVIMGFGHSGRQLHLRCLRTLAARSCGELIHTQVRLVDPRPEATAYEPHLRAYRELPLAAAGAVVHVCTPPHSHLASVLEALAKGYRFIIVEKPLAATFDDAVQIRAAAREARAVVLVVAVWLSSPLARRIGERLRDSLAPEPAELTIVHNKSRFSRTLAREDEHVFDIEMPHQISLACALLSGRPRLLSAQASDLVLNGHRKPHMARGEITLASEGGCVVRLVSNLHHPARERSITVRMRDGHRLCGYFPVGADDSFSQLFEYSAVDALIEHRVFDDDPLSTCLERCYRYLAAIGQGESPTCPPGVSLDFNVDVVTVLHEAKRHVAATGYSRPALLDKPVGVPLTA